MSASGRQNLQDLTSLIIWALVTGVAVAFALLNANAGDAALKFWPGLEPTPLPVVLVVFGSFLIGFLITALFMGVKTLRSGADQRALKRRISNLEDELQRLRNLPIEEDLHAPPETEPGESQGA